ncbi:acid phosphatase [Acrasis kona]|uniref:Acid phosphatase n=1 Tax=Acrasis kona TaxID=1008807 RepID=A0AAW2YMK9_9EUKA
MMTRSYAPLFAGALLLSSKHQIHAEEQPLKLVKVQIISRHGARTPISVIPNFKQQPWDNCLPNRHFTTSEFGNESFKFVKETFIAKQSSICEKGQLTLEGMEQMFKVGVNIFEKYRNFLKDNGVTTRANLIDQMNARSTVVSGHRTEISMQSVLSGMLSCLPPQDCLPPITINIVPSNLENMYPSGRSCPRLRKIIKQIEEKDPVIQEHLTNVMNPLKEKLDQLFQNGSSDPSKQGEKKTESIEAVTHTEPRSFPTWEGLNNTIAILQYHKRPLPEGLSDEDVEVIRDYAALKEGRIWNGDYKYDENYAPNETKRLGIGRFLGDLLTSLKSTVDGEKGPCMEIYMGHDTTLLPLLNALDVYDNRWPPMGSNVALELYVDGRNKYHVKIVYDDKLRCTLPFEEFEKNVTKLIPVDFNKECSV